MIDFDRFKAIPEDKLSKRELQFIKLCVSEMNYNEIAEIIGVSVRTVDQYRDRLFAKLDLSTRAGLIIYAIKNKIVKI